MDDVCCTAFRKLGHQPRIGYTIIPPDRPGYWWSHVKSRHPAGWWQTSGQIFISFPWFYGNSHVIPKICSHEFLATNRCERNGKSLDISNPWLPCEIFRNPWWNLHVRRIFLRKTQHIFRSSACPASNFSSGELRWEAQRLRSPCKNGGRIGAQRVLTMKIGIWSMKILKVSGEFRI